MKDTNHITDKECKREYLPIRDTLDVVGGKWKLPIVHALATGPMRFKELQRSIGVTARMLSKELKELEANELIRRDVYATAPVTVEYTLTDHGKTLKPVVQALHTWGSQHRQRIFKGRRKK